MMPFKLTGRKTLNLTSEEVALVLDSLAARPYSQVAGLIGKIVSQARDEEVANAEADAERNPE